MTRSSEAIKKTLAHEGGYVNDPHDAGGATNKGITIATFRRYVKPNGTIADLKRLTTEQAVVVYKRQYWDRVLADMLPAGVDYTVADYGVNSGPSRAVKALQSVVGVSQDGRVGPQTLAAVDSMDPSDIINKVCDQRLGFMRRIRGGKDWKRFGRGWTRRVEDVRKTSLDWASSPRALPPTRITQTDTIVVQATEKPKTGLAAFFAALLGGKS